MRVGPANRWPGVVNRAEELIFGPRGGGAVQPPADPLAQYYGVGPGQVSFDMPLHDPARMTLDASNYVSAVQHPGGAGAYFNATAAAGQQPLWDGASGVIFDGVDDFLTFATAPDLDGVHFLAAAKRIGTSQGNLATPLRVLSQPGDATARVQFTTTGINHYPGAFAWPLDTWALIESRLSEGTHTMWCNGTVIGTLAVTQAATPVAHLGRGVHSTLYRFPGAVGRSIGVVTQAGRSKDSPEPAVLAARQWLAQRYGITLA